MTPFAQLRLWLGRASVAEQASAAVGAVLVVAVIAWLLVPPQEPAGSSTGVLGTTGGAAGSVSGGGTGLSQSSAGAGAPGAGSQAGGGLGAATGGGVTSAGGSTGGSGATGAAPVGGGPVASGTGAGGCVSPPGSDQGVTQGQIKIAVILIQLLGPAANSTFGIPPPAEQQADVQDVVDSINASGGVACRKLVPVYFTGDPADTSNLQQTCINIIQAQPFFVVDLGAYYTFPQLAVCYPQAHIGYVNTGGLTAAQQKQFYPYDWGLFLYETLYRDTVFGLKQRGFFAPSGGFRKLGVMYTDCLPQLEKEFTGWLSQAGVPSSAVVGHDVGCPTGTFDSPSDLEAAILTFKQQGVTNVTFVHDTADFSNFTTVAQQQGFTPKYGIGDEGIVAIAYGSQKPNYQNIANALAITTYRYGEERTPGYPPSAGTQKCNAIFAAKGRPPVYQQPIGQGGIVCSLLWMVQGAIDHEPALLRSDVAAGLQASKSVDFSFPYGPNDFTAPGTTTAGESWRVDQFLTSCSCWQVVDRNYHPSA